MASWYYADWSGDVSYHQGLNVVSSFAINKSIGLWVFHWVSFSIDWQIHARSAISKNDRFTMMLQHRLAKSMPEFCWRNPPHSSSVFVGVCWLAANTLSFLACFLFFFFFCSSCGTSPFRFYSSVQVLTGHDSGTYRALSHGLSLWGNTKFGPSALEFLVYFRVPVKLSLHPRNKLLPKISVW